MISPQMIQRLLIESKLSENELSQRIFVPCLLKMSMIMGHAFRDVKFCGGNAELGNDIEFYEVIGPDRYRFYTGIQVKKGDINQNLATDLTRQGAQAFEKSIVDPSTGHTFRFGRWIVAATGNIKAPARDIINKELTRYGKLISFWDGTKLSEFILDYFYDEFVRELGVDPIIAGSQNVTNTFYDPDNPIVLLDHFDSGNWLDIDLSQAIPPAGLADAAFLMIRPHAGNSSRVIIGVKTSVDDIVIDSFMSQIYPIPVRLSNDETSCKVRLFQGTGPVKVACRGYRSMR